MKYLTAKLIDGSAWGYPATIVAKDRADAYSPEEDLYEDTLNDDFELREWALNNMDIWEDVENWRKLKEPETYNLKDMLQYAVTGYGKLEGIAYNGDDGCGVDVEEIEDK